MMPPIPPHLQPDDVAPLAPFLRAGIDAALWTGEGRLAWASAEGQGKAPEPSPDLRDVIAGLLAALKPGSIRMAALPLADGPVNAACLHVRDAEGAPAILAALLKPLRQKGPPSDESFLLHEAPQPPAAAVAAPSGLAKGSLPLPPPAYEAPRIVLDWLGTAPAAAPRAGMRRSNQRRSAPLAEENEAQEIRVWATQTAARFGEAMSEAALLAREVLGRASVPRPAPVLTVVRAPEPAVMAETAATSPPPSPAPASPATSPAASRRREALTDADRQTLREIARALGGPAAASPAAVEADSLVPATPVSVAEAPAEAPAAPARDRETGILDALPVPLLVKRAGRAVHANRALLALTGAADLAAAERAGLHALPPGAASVLVQTPAGPALMRALTSHDAWRGEAAEFVALLPAEFSGDERSARELAAILDTATDGVVVLDETGHILSLNRSAQALFGYETVEVKGKPFTLLFATASHPVAIDYLEGLRSNGVASILNDGREVAGRVRQGGELPLFLTLGTISDGPDRKFCAVLRDLTAWKKAEGELLAAKRSAELSSSHKSDFLAAISHEIRTPLNAIIGFAELMGEERFGPVGNQRYKDYLRDIRASGTHVISLINDLLDLAKIEAGKMELTFMGVDLNEIVRSSTSFLQTQAGRERIVLRSSLAPSLPPVVADERSLRQVVLNVLSNAVKFTDPGGQVIISTAYTDRGEVTLRVRDTGIGMTQDELKAALEPFRRIATSRSTGGTGLGLPLTKALVEANRAGMSIASEKGEGTLVEVVFPPTRVLAN